MSAARNADSSSARSLSGVFCRLPKAVLKSAAWLTAFVIALGGVTLAQSWMSAGKAQAVKFQGGWDGKFTRNQLWIKPGLDSNDMRAVNQPWNVTTINSTTAPVLFNPDTSGNGSNAPGRDTIAVGPIFKWAGEDTLHMVDLNGGTGDNSSLFLSDLAGRKVNGVSISSGFPSCGKTNRAGFSAEINQKNGYLYAVGGGASPQISTAKGTTLDDITPRILRVNRSGTSGDARYTCVAAVNGSEIRSATGSSLSDQWNAMTKQNISVTWNAGSDMAIDANGNLYLMAYNNATRHALVRLNVPRNSSGQPLSSGWTYEVVRTFTTNTTSSSVWGMAFMNGKLYTAHADNDFWRWDTLTGAAESLGSAFDPVDLAAAQMAPVISGKVYNDTNGDGDVTGEPGAGNVTVEIWQGNAGSGSTSWTKRGEVITNSAGNYSALLNSATTEFLVRVKRPMVNGVNAVQTYASAGDFYESGTSGTANTLRPYCATNSADYQLSSGSGACSGARRDGVDALTATAGNPLALSGGALVVSRVDMNTDMAVVQTDFGVTAAASWGDAPVGPTTRAQQGPYASPYRAGEPYLFLGDTAGVYADGVTDATANAHPTDDGLYMAPLVKGVDDADRDWAPAQSQIMVQGKEYRFRAKADGDSAAVAAATVRAWITASSTSFTGSSTALLGGGDCTPTPDDGGYVYCTYTAAATLPAGGIAQMYARARVSNDVNVTAV
ncbi:MAG: hypothetical protein LBG11_03945, partial [Bifidobacteriaceae bacterium]|nr:hypothetical protein [Bifidobacteriaceae bacterium]